MRKQNNTLNDVFEMFQDFVNEDDVVSALLMAEVSSSIAKYRIKHNMTQKDLAQFLDISQAMVSKIESEGYNFTIKQLVKLCNKMNMNIQIVISEENSEKDNIEYQQVQHNNIAGEYAVNENKTKYDKNK